MKYLLLGLTLLFTACSNPQYEEKLIKRISVDYVKRIFLVASPEKVGACSSVFVSYKGKIRHVTNSHCCPDSVYVVYDKKAVQVVKKDLSVDLCEITHDDMPIRGLFTALEDSEIGDKVYISGFPRGHYFSISEGHTTSGLYRSDVENLTNLPLIRTNAFFDHGGSGGAVINSTGYLVGIAAVVHTPSLQGSFIPVSFLKKFLDK